MSDAVFREHAPGDGCKQFGVRGLPLGYWSDAIAPLTQLRLGSPPARQACATLSPRFARGEGILWVRRWIYSQLSIYIAAILIFVSAAHSPARADELADLVAKLGSESFADKEAA